MDDSRRATRDLEREGVIGPIRVIDEAAAERLLLLCVEAHSSISSVYRQVSLRDRHLEWPEVLAACSAPALLDLIAVLLGPDLLLWRSKFMIKPPGGAEIGWHRDGRFPGYLDRPALKRPEAASAWIALTPTDLAVGGLEFAPRSNRTLDAAEAQGWGIVNEPPASAERRSWPLAAGEAVVFSALVLHRSLANRSGHARIGLSARYTTPSNEVNADLPDGIDGQGYPADRHVSVLLRGQATRGSNRVVRPLDLFHPPPSTTE